MLAMYGLFDEKKNRFGPSDFNYRSLTTMTQQLPQLPQFGQHAWAVFVQDTMTRRADLCGSRYELAPVLLLFLLQHFLATVE